MKRGILIVVAALLTATITGIAFISQDNGLLTMMIPDSSDGSTYNLNSNSLNMLKAENGIDTSIVVHNDGVYIDRIESELNKDSNIDLFYTVFNRGIKNIGDNKLYSFRKTINSNISEVFYSFSMDKKGFSYVPVTWAPWGIYYNKSTFSRLNISEPKSLEDLEAISEILKGEGITPYSMVQNYQWPITAWFEYLNLRINGYEFHNALLNGEVSFLDKRVEAIYLEIFNMIQNGDFYIEENSDLNWQNLTALLESGECAMFLGSTFFFNAIENKDDIGWFPFPISHENIDKSEVVSSSGYIVSNYSKNKKSVKKYLDLALKNSIQSSIYDNSNLIPVNYDVAKTIYRIDIDNGYSNLKNVHKLLPSFERNCNPKLLPAFKWSLSSMFNIGNSEEVVLILEKIEKSRQGLKIEK